jgi:predicted alpha/beta-fold hydrolase
MQEDLILLELAEIFDKVYQRRNFEEISTDKRMPYQKVEDYYKDDLNYLEKVQKEILILREI